MWLWHSDSVGYNIAINVSYPNFSEVRYAASLADILRKTLFRSVWFLIEGESGLVAKMVALLSTNHNESIALIMIDGRATKAYHS